MQRPLPRSEAFFGMHLDLHPQETDTNLGADIEEQYLRELLRRIKPDYVQYDCKGHAGWAGYPTRVGSASPGIVKDSLALWRKATRDLGIGLFVHFSGLWDSRAIQLHPEWARQGPNGERDPNNTSVFSDYREKLLVPQLVEVALAYDLDGAWVDGECWAAQLDWSPGALAAWRRETGRTEAPKQRGDPHWEEWKAFHRRHFEDYVAKWVTAVKQQAPRMQLTSNWMYTTFAPIPPRAPLDFLSGDYSPTVSADRGRVEARFLANAGKPWDLMAWGFNWHPQLGHSLKPAPQLMQEAGAVLMQGGGFQVYYQPTRSGYLVPEIVEIMEQVARFCRERQAISHKSSTVPQVALLYSTASQLERSDAVFNPYGCTDEIEGALHALLELQYSVDLMPEYQLQPRLAEFPLVVLADSHRLEEPFRQALVEYVRGGGSLLLLGEKCARLFERELGVQFTGPLGQAAAELKTSLGVVNCSGQWQPVAADAAHVRARRYPTRDTRTGGEIAATVTPFGQGKIGAVYGPIALAHFRSHHPALRALVRDLARELFPRPAVTVEGPDSVDVALRRTAQGKLSVHLLNLTNAQRADRFQHVETIPPVGPLTVRIACEQKPRSIRWVPGSTKPRWTWAEGTAIVTVPKLAIHGVLVVEQ